MPISLSPDLPVSFEDWERTLPAVQALIVALWEEVQVLRVKVGELSERVGRHSQNSSRPPSSDPLGVPKRERKVSGRKVGGQPGHRGKGRKLLSVEEVDEVVEVNPEVCGKCGHVLCGSDPAPARHQVTDLPPVVCTTTEYRLHTLGCPECGEQTRAQLPDGVSWGRFGARLQAMVGVLSGASRLS